MTSSGHPPPRRYHFVAGEGGLHDTRDEFYRWNREENRPDEIESRPDLRGAAGLDLLLGDRR